MTDNRSPEHAPLSADQLALKRTELASNRTLMAADRSLMAWIRTGLSMISFGFSIYRVLEGFQGSTATADVAQSPRTVGLLLTGLGTLAVVMGTIEYWQRRRELLVHGPIKLWRPAFLMAITMSVIGLALFFGITTRVL